MKNMVIIGLFGILFFGCETKEDRKNSLKEMNLFGKVKSIKKITTGEVKKGFEEIYSNYDSHYNYSFDNEGRLIQKSYTFNNELWTEEYKYESHNLIEKVRHTEDEDRESDIYLFTYDKFGNLMTENYTWGDREVKELRNEYIYNDKGNLIKQIEYSEYYYLDDDTTMRSIFLFEYDADGSIVRENIYNGDGSHSFFRESYYKDDLLVTENFKDGTTTYKYDEFGNEISEVNAYEGYAPEETKTKYLFDNKNNWVKKESLSEGYLKIVKREIDYFD